MGQAGTVAVAAADGLVKALWHSIAVLPFVLESSPVDVCNGDNMVGGETPDVLVLI